MSKPLPIICACVAALGMLILGRSTFLTIAYGHGNMEAGNFNRCWYSSKRDPQTSRIVREWDVHGESTEDSTIDRFARGFDMWLVGLTILILGIGSFFFVLRFQR